MVGEVSHTASDSITSRTEMLIGREGLERLSNSHVMVIGLGGVGGYTVEVLARSGVGRLTLVDPDVVKESNLNRQIIALQNTIGQPKATLWRDRVLAINPRIEVDARQIFVRDEATVALLEDTAPDFVVDAIDTPSPKLYLIKALQERQVPFITVVGTGAMMDPTQIDIAPMGKVRNCPLAKLLRKRLRRLRVSLDFPVVYSRELPIPSAIQHSESEQNKKSVAGTIAYNPAVAGCYAAYGAIRHLLKE